MNNLELIKQTIRIMYKCDVTEHLQTVPLWIGNWEGDVDLFAVRGCPAADTVFGWSFYNPDKEATTTVVIAPAIPLIATPEAAVRAYLAKLHGESQQ